MTELVQTEPSPAPSLGTRVEIVPIFLFAAFAAAPLLATVSGAEGYVLSLLTRVMIFGIAAMALDLILGYGALVSFGHAAFLGLGGYAVGILASHGIDDALVQVPVALAASALFALVTGAISLRTKGVYFIMITLAFGQMLYFLATSLAAYGGDDGMTLPSRSLVAGFSVLKSDFTFYWICLLCLLGTYAFSRAVVASRFGRVLRGTRDNATRMEAIGFRPFRFQLTAYVISGMMTGLAGCLLANQAEFVSPAFMTWQRSGELIFMVVLGGLGSLHGAIIGAAAFLLLEEFLPEILHAASFFLSDEVRDHLAENWKMVFGPLLILVVLFARGGIMGLLRRPRHG
ncbi:branched-chain amino acid transport system permease protein [Microvirga flocculans]|uniref:Branched-chain amino acid transport system permease protein n=1 Tax=Microvirga flocculans TaxID=217168 RepID=A0A7W6IDY7_9HYPH|nr:branched-chain amino acid ABC transporter permease [Microvirga flocculans]MBB4039710.1 branched-chain amino acid transport system permease protein [Microvirga flocculans]